MGERSTTLLGVEISNQVPEAAIGLIVAQGVTLAPASPTLAAAIARDVAQVRTSALNEERTKVVRDLLRFGKYKPTGRGKPASEYLQGAAREDRFPAINNLVDALNRVSLMSQLPISLIDLDRAASQRFVVRRGREGESYVFNASGQVIELQDLLLVAALPEDRPGANPGKDSMATQLDGATKNVLAVVYAPASLAEVAAAATTALAEELAREASPRELRQALLGV